MPALESVAQCTLNPVFGLVAGESSGDILGAGLILELKARYPDAEFVGIGGPLMQKAGLHSLFKMERLSVMGFVEPLKRLPELLKIRASIVSFFKKNPPEIFIGIDAPDFNLGIEKRLKRSGIKTVHYVSPSVWAWRQWRIKKIKAATHQVLCAFPFEVAFYEKHSHPATFVGHPMADDIPLLVDKSEAKRSLGLMEDGLTVAILPGSRSKEIALLGPLFLEIAKKIQANAEVGELVVAAASESAYKTIKAMAKDAELEIRLFQGKAREVLLAADVALAASGTVTLEGMLTKTPMVVAYKIEKASFWIASKLVKTKYISLPNILANECLVSEFIQEDAQVETIAKDLNDLVSDNVRRTKMCESFALHHQSLKRGASARAADAVSLLLESQNVE